MGTFRRVVVRLSLASASLYGKVWYHHTIEQRAVEASSKKEQQQYGMAWHGMVGMVSYGDNKGDGYSD